MRKILFFFLIAVLWSCQNEPPLPPKLVEKPQPIRKIACVGDQMTLGIGLDSAATFPAQLQKILGDRYIVQSFATDEAISFKNNKNSYWTDTTQFKNLNAFQPDIILVWLGTNDTKMWYWYKYGNNFSNDYSLLLDTLTQLSNSARLMVCRPTRVFNTIGGINDSTLSLALLPQIDTIATRRKLETLDFYGILHERGDLFPDGVHLNETGVRILAELAAEAIVSKYR